MKRYILALIPISYLTAGPVIAPLVDYDKEDIIVAKKEIKKKIIVPTATVPVVKAPGVRVIEKSYPGYEIDALIGRNFADDDSVLKDATTAGIRLNKYITEDFAIQIGYDRVFDADYKRASYKKLSSRSIPVCEDSPSSCENNPTDNGSGGDTPGGGNGHPGNDNQNDSGTGGDNSSDNPLSNLGVGKVAKSTDIDRFYLNALKEIHSQNSALIPYLFAGIGYEHITDENYGLESQGFFNAGGGLKYKIDDTLRVVSEAKAIKKFKDRDLDIVAMLGLGMLFGEKRVIVNNAPQTDENLLPDVRVENDKAPELTADTESFDSKEQITETVPQSSEIELMIEAAPEETQTLLPEEKSEFEKSYDKEQNDKPYYIQVAVVTKERSLNNYLAKIRDNDLSYEIKPVSITNPFAKRILIGPYVSRLDAKMDMPIVKEEIEKRAFIKRFTR